MEKLEPPPRRDPCSPNSLKSCEKLNYKRLKSFNKRNKEKLELAAALNAQRRAESGEITEEGKRGKPEKIWKENQ
ncbi:hypothetical protein ANCCEY_12948 [Ancylostoma ceylanicum]|uniref:Uncharacterized protein n=1 Tax=Ancylostoma ceylanicum TaxID=53326 RepID=A0A0D6L851_9BILA|nr:hypothetical protein ANCCEY_12948 [Ancylostoma ceylanicum]